jgi:hypothetical protein
MENVKHTAQSKATHRKAKPNPNPTLEAQNRPKPFQPRAGQARASGSGQRPTIGPEAYDRDRPGTRARHSVALCRGNADLSQRPRQL